MSAANSEPWEFASLDALLAIAGAMEREAIDGYAALSKRMTEMGRLDLAHVFEELVSEETGHLRQVQDWSEASGHPLANVDVTAPANLYDDEGAGVVAPEMLSAYRAFSTAVRNEERAFMFWENNPCKYNIKKMRIQSREGLVVVTQISLANETNLDNALETLKPH